MKNTRWFRFIVGLLALVMVLTLAPLFGLTEGEGSDDNPSSNPPKEVEGGYEVGNYSFKQRPKEVTVNASVSYIDGNGKTVAVGAMDPNQNNRMQVSVSGLNENAEISKDTHLLVELSDEIVITETALAAAANDAVNVGMQTNSETGKNQMVISWKSDKQDQVNITVAVVPNLPQTVALSDGSYIIATGEAMLGDTTWSDNGRGKIKSYPIEISGGVIDPKTTKNPVWRIKHITGNYFTVYSETANQYLRIYPKNTGGFSGNGSVALESATEDTAQKILIEDAGNNTYTFKYNGYVLNNSGENKYLGFASYTYENKANYKFTLYSPSQVKTSASRDLSGNWVFVNETRTRILSSDSNQGGKLKAVSYNKIDDGTLVQNNNIDIWTFEHIIRDWYYVSCGGNYLNVSKNGVYVSGERKPLLAVSDDGFKTFTLTDGDFATNNGNYYSLKSADNDSFNASIGGLNDDYRKMTLLSISQFANNDVQISGSWAITTDSLGAALVAEATGSTLASVPYEMAEGEKVYSTEKVITSWTFHKENGNWYTIQADNGKYLSISNTSKSIQLSDSPVRIFVQEHNGKYRLTAGNQYALKNNKTKGSDGYAGNDNGKAKEAKEWHTLRPVYSSSILGKLIFDINGGTVTNPPATKLAAVGETIILPDVDGNKDGNAFIGWCEVDSVYKQVSGTNHTYHDVYKAGTSYTLKNSTNTLYAIYNNKGTKKVRFGIRKDGVIQDEPNGYKVEGYIGHFEQDLSILKETHWVIDIDTTKPVNGYYVDNDVIANLNWVPSAEVIAAALQDEGEVSFDPETQYIHYYVLKCVPDTTWKIDGVIRNKAQVAISYDTNVPAGKDKTAVTNMPGSYQVAPGTDILIGADKNSTEIKRPGLQGYYFMGWNTKKDGSGEYYNESVTVHLTNNLYLYAQWISAADAPLEIRISSDWTKGQTGYVGAKITLTAHLTGFENKQYTLQWQYSTTPDDPNSWVDVSGAHGMTYTYYLDEINTNYSWRVVAQDIH